MRTAEVVAGTTRTNDRGRHAQRHPGRTSQRLDTAFNPDANSLGLMRLVFAAMVLVNHAFPLGGFHGGVDPSWGWTKGQQDLGGFAVDGFFVVSGFLVTRSFLSSSTSVRYLWKRVLRIFPGFWVCLIVTVVLFGTLAFHYEHGTLHGYLHGYPDPPGDYLRRNALLTMNQYGINSLLAGNPWPNAWNGSLWTLIYEFKCYLGVMVLGIFGVLQRGRLFVLALTAFLWVAEVGEYFSPATVKRAVPLFADLELVQLAFMFSLGACLYLFRERIPLSRWWGGVAVGALVVSVVVHGLFYAVGQPAFAYLCLWGAVWIPIRSFDRFGDFSYGLYVYAFPVEQLASLYGINKWGLAPYLAITFPISLMFAVISWFVVERTFLNLKRLKLPTLWRPPAWWGEKVQGRRPAVEDVPGTHPEPVAGTPREHGDHGPRGAAAGRPAGDQPDLSSAPNVH